MKTSHRKQVGILISIALFFVQACGTVATVSTATPLPASACDYPDSLSQQVTLTSISFKEEGQSPVTRFLRKRRNLQAVTIHARKPSTRKWMVLSRARSNTFRKNILAQIPVSSVSAGSFFDAQYTVIFQSE